MASESKTTTDHEEIRRWVESHEGRPAIARGTGGDNAGVLSIEFSGVTAGARPSGLEIIEWNEWFDKFDEADLAFLYQEHQSDGSDSRFCRIIRR
ncbi:hypothetical protein [Tomitella cavernea]|uniref:1,4-alpha-glucan branching enzyme n=1 Tax=Tomitella cavernea TaxID=1387982 RepID=A0ABP9CPT3_9ACTN|nr:hypothetical protein [Tomitella cavernea]